jgi:3-oxoadipate enol-lactonase
MMQAVELFFEQFGHGNPIIFLHGYPLDHTIWLPLVPLMEKETRLILPDLRGHGQSPYPAGTYSMQLMAMDILVLMDKLNIPQAVLAGHSMGGYVALSFARDYPERLAGLALVASHCFADSPEQQKNRLETAHKVEQFCRVDFIAESMILNLTADPSLQEGLKKLMLNARPNGVAGVLRGMAKREGTCDVFRTLNKPVVFVAGEKDQLIPLQRSKEMATGLKKSWLEIIPNAGHMPMLEAPSLVAKVFLSFLREIHSSV